jgi:hypothetical protein
VERGRVILAAAPSPANPVADHSLSPTATAVLIVIAFIIDYFAFLPAFLQTRLTFMCVAVGVRQGFDDSPLDKWTVDNASGLIQSLLDQAKGSYIAGASATVLVGCVVGALSIWTLGCMLPGKWSQKLGRFSTAKFKESGLRKMTWQVWLLAIPLGLLADMPEGWMGWLTDASMNIYSLITTPLPSLIFGAS